MPKCTCLSVNISSLGIWNIVLVSRSLLRSGHLKEPHVILKSGLPPELHPSLHWLHWLGSCWLEWEFSSHVDPYFRCLISDTLIAKWIPPVSLIIRWYILELSCCTCLSWWLRSSLLAVQPYWYIVHSVLWDHSHHPSTFPSLLMDLGNIHATWYPMKKCCWSFTQLAAVFQMI